jgi:hypothetical protein
MVVTTVRRIREIHVSKGTTIRGVRIEDELWEAARAKAATEETNISEVIRELLAEWVSRAD